MRVAPPPGIDFPRPKTEAVAAAGYPCADPSLRDPSPWSPSLWRGGAHGWAAPPGLAPQEHGKDGYQDLRSWAEAQADAPRLSVDVRSPAGSQRQALSWADLVSPDLSAAEPRVLPPLPGLKFMLNRKGSESPWSCSSCGSPAHFARASPTHAGGAAGDAEGELAARRSGAEPKAAARASRSAPTSPAAQHLERRDTGLTVCSLCSRLSERSAWSASGPRKRGLKLSVNRRGLKHACQFLVPEVIAEDPGFKAVKFLIGKGGAHMRGIAEETEAKLRVRGRGSGHLEGPSNAESTDPLMLCVSCADRYGYETARFAVEQLFGRLFEAYRRHCVKQQHPAPDLQLVVIE